MVRPGLVNLDFADVETVMKGMGKAMMGTGEAEGEKRAQEATNAALNNPLIDEYSLKGAKGLLVNITGGSDLTTFEVDEAVNTIRAEVDPEAELIFGSIEDERLNGKIRVSIVATSLDGHEPETKPVVSMVHRLHNRNSGYSNNLNSAPINNHPTLNATEGATALDINTVIDQTHDTQQEAVIEKTVEEPSLANISMENAAYLQDIKEESLKEDLPRFEVESIELETPDLFTDEKNDSNFNQDLSNESEPQIFDNSKSESENLEKEQEMFEENNSEEEFEIPAFLRRQKN